MLYIDQRVVTVAQRGILRAFNYIVIKGIGNGRDIDQYHLAVFFLVGGNEILR